MKILLISVFALVLFLPTNSRAQQKPVAVPGTGDVEMAPSSSPLVARGTADTSRQYENELRLRVQLLRQKYKLLLEKTKLNESREGGPDLEELKEERKGLEALKREVEKAEVPLNAIIVEEGRASRVIGGMPPASVSGPAVH